MEEKGLLPDFDDSKKRRRKYFILGGILLAIIVIVVIIVVVCKAKKSKEGDVKEVDDADLEKNVYYGNPQQLCKCPSSSYFQPAPKTIGNDPNFTPSDVVIDGTNYGKPFQIGGLVFLSKEVYVKKGSASLPNGCPVGYRLPTKIEYEQMINNLGVNLYTEIHNTTGFNFQTDKYYMTSTRVYPTVSSEYVEAFAFYALTEAPNKTISLESINTYQTPNNMTAKCIFDSTQAKTNIQGVDQDLVINEKRSIVLDRSVLKGFLWRIDNKIYENKNTIEVKNTKRGCNLIEVWGNTINDKQIYSCNVIYTSPKLANSVEASFSLSKVSELNYEFSAQRVSQMYFERPQAPIAPKATGGFYLAYTDKSANDLRILEFDSSDKLISNKTLEYKAYPLDIIETDYGFAIYARNASDADHSFIVTYYSNYTKKVETTIMKNGNDPSKVMKALLFYASNGDTLYGTSKMYSPHNGKLAYGKGKLNLIFAHYNNFTTEGGNSGDSYYSLEPEGDYNSAKYAWSWLTSHSLIQSHIYDGKYFITAALGDNQPQGITFAVIDIQGELQSYDSRKQQLCQYSYIQKKNLITSFPGSQTGNTMGRLGQLMDFGSFYAVVYSIKKSATETRDGIFLTTFKKDADSIVAIKEAKIIGDIAGKLKNIRCARYGNRILITYILNTSDYGTDYPSYYQDLNEKMYYLLSDTDGNVKAGPLEAKTQHQALSEDIRPLNDGSLRWGYIDAKNILRIVKVSAPSA